MQESSVKTAGESPDALQPWQLFTLAGLIGATIVVFMSRGQTPAGIILLSLIIFAAACVGLAALRTFLPLAGVIVESTTELLGGRTRAALEREKTLVLRSIKELEFDRGMGKVSEKDFTEMSARLRARAGRLMRQLDAGSLYREQIEREIERRLGHAAPVARGAAGPDARSEDPERHVPIPIPESRIPDAELQAPTPESRVPGLAAELCSSCNTTNDPDARFCKNCGARMERPA